MFGWVDRLAEAIFRRGRGLVEVSDRVAEEKRTAIRTVRDALRDAMASAENDRERGMNNERIASLNAAHLASATVQEVADEEARSLVAEWRRQYDAIEKGWKKGVESAMGTTYGPPGYPEPAWSALRAAADAAHDRLGVLLRGLLEGPS